MHHESENLAPPGPSADNSKPVELETQYYRHRLSKPEIFWRDQSLWLKENGYQLRPRYHPEWVPSWREDKERDWISEDGQPMQSLGNLLDATRTSDGAMVMLKKVRVTEHPFEEDIEDVLHAPNDEKTILIVMPFLSRWTKPALETVGETIELFRQLFEGLQYMHSLGVAHNDIKVDNIMLDARPLYEEPVHPTNSRMKLDYSGEAKPPRSRTLRPVRYYHIDFGHASQYSTKDEDRGGPPRMFIEAGYGGDLSVPEFKTQNYCDPFAVDVYRMGNVVRREFTQGGSFTPKKRGLEIMEPLLRDKCQDDPAKRPTMDVVVQRYSEITRRLSWWKLRARIVEVDEPFPVTLFRAPMHWAKQLSRIARSIPAIPNA